MGKLTDVLNELHLDNQLTPDKIPSIDLYMDQVIQLFERTFESSTRNEEEKVLTKTMINNYAKGKLLFPIQQKKYSKEHLLLISLIYQLKGSLSINDIKTTLSGINERIGDIDLDSFYEEFLTVAADNVKHGRTDIAGRIEDITVRTDELGQIMQILALVHMSNMYRKTAEKLVDQLAEKKNLS